MIPVPAHPRAFRPSPLSYYAVCRALRTLRCPPTLLDTLTSFGELQDRLVPLYRRLAKQYHPDMAIQRRGKGKGRPLTGASFRQITRAYACLMRVPPDRALPSPRAHMAPELFHVSPPIFECALPSSLDRKPPRLPPGYQEDLTRYWYA